MKPRYRYLPKSTLLSLTTHDVSVWMRSRLLAAGWYAHVCRAGIVQASDLERCLSETVVSHLSILMYV